ncbi:ABC transporter ATP-binding protein/permease [Basilea psittacipulmonis]|uniref:ABC transporter ATP-binding protein n=1 Tax=Basilea psittacipulmonis DSM 24701 TaxID=1072685 RepID=A0A077DGF6_9BURK|nr:ABC transporter ATP-binding protein/permease [Basilea psittacipulmonis]AIL32213.1 hypothetical protein IX83_01800 [Basilea psittacipulmonis DSM 24701]
MEKWQITLFETPWWLLETFLSIVMVCVVIIFCLSKTRFGQQFAQIVQPSLTKKSLLKLILALSIMLLLLLTEVRLNVLNTFLYNGMYASLQKMVWVAFWSFALANVVVVCLRSLNDSFNSFLDKALAIKWSESLNQILLERWLKDKNYYRLQKQHEKPDNIDQRIQQDVQDFISTTIEFIRGMVDAIVSAIEFTIVLWGLSGVLSLFGVDIPGWIVFFVYIFVILTTSLAMWIGKPLVRYNYDNEKLNGNYRYSLIRVRDYAESIAFYQGEEPEKKHLLARYASIIHNRWKIAKQSVLLTGFNTLLTQGVQLLPLMLQAPRFFAGQITIGDMHQTVQSFNRLQRALSFFRNFYESFTAYRARLERLSGFMSQLDNMPEITQATLDKTDECLLLKDVTLYRRDGSVLVDHIHFSAKAGDALLIKGPSGCGKTSLLRMLAGIWTHGSSGYVQHPSQNDTMFVPQHAYMPEGGLREGICYPNIQVKEGELEEAMRLCCLEKWIYHLDRGDGWQQRLSPGELQRIAFIRVLLTKPKFILLDESTSALDEETERRVYQVIKEQLPDSIIVSIGHRSSLEQYHNKIYHLA